MQQANWYSKKRTWFFLVLILYVFVLQLEWAKMRYNPNELLSDLKQKHHLDASLGTKQIGELRIQYLSIKENPNLDLLVLVHGSPGSLTAYEKYYTDQRILENFQIISVDRLGFGYSSFGNSESSLVTHAKAIAGILEAYPNQKKIIVGHSMGGPIIAKLAMNFPELTDGLVMVAPSISPFLEPSNTWRKILDFLPFRILSPSALRVCNQEIIPLKEELSLMLGDWANIKVPVSLIQGKEDNLVPQGNADFAKQMLTNSPSVSIRKITGNHFILWSEIELIKQEIFQLAKNLKELKKH